MIPNRIKSYFHHAVMLCCFIISLTASAQKRTIDSLYTGLKKVPLADSVKVDICYELAYNYQYLYPDSVVPLAAKGYALAKKTGSATGMAKCLKLIGVGYYYINDYEKALQFDSLAMHAYGLLRDTQGLGAVYNNIAIVCQNKAMYNDALANYEISLQYRRICNDTKGIGASLTNIGNTYYSLGKYAEALMSYLSGLKIRETLNDKQSIANSCSNIAMVYYAMGKFQKSLDYNLRSIKLSEEAESISGAINAYINAGGVLVEMGRNSEALAYYEKAYALASANGFTIETRICLGNMGELYGLAGNYPKSIALYNLAIKMGAEMDDPEGDASTYIGIGAIYLRKREMQKAIDYLIKAYQVSTKVNFKVGISASSDSLAAAYYLLGDYKNAYLYKEIFSSYKDSLINDQTNKKIAETEFNFELEKKQKEIVLLEKDNAIGEKENDEQKLISIGLGAFLILFIIISIIVFRSRQKEKKSGRLILKQKEEIQEQSNKLEELNKVKDKIFSILSHDLRAPVSMLTNIITLLEINTITHQDFLIIKRSLEKQLSGLNVFLDNLLYWSKSQMEGQTGVRKESFFLAQLIDQIFLLFNENAAQKKIKLLNAIPHHIMLFSDKNQMEIVFRNLISNAIKFTNGMGEVHVDARQEDGFIIIEVSDSGIGISAELAEQLLQGLTNRSTAGTFGEKGTGLGLMLCKEFVEKNEGTIVVRSEVGKGTTFIVKLPVY